MTHEKDRPDDYLATSLNSLNLPIFSIYWYVSLSKS